jgi:tetratricopeptide (TPR) repeat protein
MKSLWLKLTVLVALSGVLCAADLMYSSITTNEEAEIKQKLEAYEKGKVEAFTLIEKEGSEGARKFTEYFLLHTNDISPKAKLPISLCYFGFDRYPQAARLVREYLAVYTNDAYGWRILGNCLFSMNATNEAIHAYQTAIKFGDLESCEPLAGVAFMSGRMDIIRDVIPQLQELQCAKDTPKQNKLSVVSLLLAYSLMTHQKDLFVKTLKGEDLKELLSSDNIKVNINSGCHVFEGKDIDRIREKFEKAKNSNQK